jgi:hypothetical protein
LRIFSTFIYSVFFDILYFTLSEKGGVEMK